MFELNIPISIKSELTLSDKAKKALQIHKEYASKSSNPKWHRTQSEKSESSQFYLHNKDVIERYESDIYNHLTYSKGNINNRISSLKKSIKNYYEFREFCYNSSAGQIYFQDHWEYCHNSKKECFSYVETLQEQLCKLESKRNSVKFVADLENDVYEIMGIQKQITQSKLFSYYPASYKNKIKKILDEWESYDAIKRTKYKNTYMIELLD